MYFMARHTSIDCFEKRGRKGYLFIIGDELAYRKVKKAEVRRVIGDEVGEDIRTEAILAELKRRYHVYYILPAGASYVGDARTTEYWRNLLGQNFIELDDLDAVCETIALTIGLGEEAIDLEEGLDDLVTVGSTAGASVSKALATVGSGGPRGTLVVGGSLGGSDDADSTDPDAGSEDGLIRL
jgi:hypothetical protein